MKNDYPHKTIVELAEKEERIILTRDQNLLKQNLVSVSYCLRSQHANGQLMEVIRRFNLKRSSKFFEDVGMRRKNKERFKKQRYCPMRLHNVL